MAQELTEPCSGLVMAMDVGWMEAHTQNTAANAECRIQYDNLVRAVRSRERD